MAAPPSRQAKRCRLRQLPERESIEGYWAAAKCPYLPMRRLTASSYAARRLGHRSPRSRTTRWARQQLLSASQPGQHQRVVRRHLQILGQGG